MSTTGEYLDHLVRETHRPEAEVLAAAIQTGLRQLWREQVLGRFMKGEVSREEAVRDVGIDLVEMAERQQQAIHEDLAWASRLSP